MPVNVTKREFIHPHKFGDGLKLLEFGCSSSGTLLGLAVLLAQANGKGGGDLVARGSGSSQRMIDVVSGRWCGDRIVIASDYGDDGQLVSAEDEKEYPKSLRAEHKKLVAEAKANGKKPPDEDGGRSPRLYEVAHRCYKDISKEVLGAMMQDRYVREDLLDRGIIREDGTVVEDFRERYSRATARRVEKSAAGAAE